MDKLQIECGMNTCLFWENKKQHYYLRFINLIINNIPNSGICAFTFILHFVWYSLFISGMQYLRLPCFSFASFVCLLFGYNADIALKLKQKYEFRGIDMVIQILFWYFAERKSTAASFYLTYQSTLYWFMLMFVFKDI